MSISSINLNWIIFEWSVRRREPCAVCNLPVFIAQKLRVEGRLYHRTCFRCARCNAQLSPADYYETCGGEYVCETCPDEMAAVEGSNETQQQPALGIESPAFRIESPVPPSPAAPPTPTMPPEPPPPSSSLVAMRRLMFDTDDAKLMKHDHAVHSTRIVPSINKDLSTNVDTSSRIDDERVDFVNTEKSKELPPEAESSFKNSKTLVECVNSSTIPSSLSQSECVRDPDKEELSPLLNENENDSIKLVANVDKENLVLSKDTPSFNDDCNTLSTEHSEINEVAEPNEVKKDNTDNTGDLPVKEVVEAINHDVISPNDTQETTTSLLSESLTLDCEPSVKKDSEEYPDDLNPFGDTDEEEDRKDIPKIKVSTNPFGSDSEEEEPPPIPVKPPPRTTPRKMSIGMRSTASTNPFDSDEDDEETPPVPLSRLSHQSSPEPTPFPRRNKLRNSARSITSLSSIGSYSSTSPRKKKPAPPPPTQSANLTPSSRYSSMTSLSSTLTSPRSRKTKRAPLPPSPAPPKPPSTAPPSPAPPKPPRTFDSLVQESISPPNEPASPSQMHSLSSVSDEASFQTAGEIMSQIEEGMQKLMMQEDHNEGNHSVPLPSKEEKDTINETSKAESALTVEDVEEVPIVVKSEEETISREDSEITEQDKEIINDTEIMKSAISEKEHEVPVVILNAEEEKLIEESDCDKVLEFADKTETESIEKTGPIVEAFNEEILSLSKNSSVIKFEEINPPVHSTPVKITPSPALLESSLEDVASGNYLSSPSASCADTSSYQESLSSPPLEKKYKDSANMHKKITESGVYQPHKSTYGQWKRKKAPAPPLPIPQRRIVKPMAIQRIRQELGDIEIKQQELERQGVALEQKIREKFDSDTSITPYLEELVLQLFELVNEKNELFRKQAELMYLRRQNQLEEEHAELEYQIRCLMARPEPNKTDSDKELEEKLIQRLIEVVERRDAIVQCLEMDRLRENEEDKSINRQLDKFTRAIVTDERMKIKKKHKKKKDKHNTLKMLDLDKDFDESEKDSKKKKKWYTLHHRMSKNL